MSVSLDELNKAVQSLAKSIELYTQTAASDPELKKALRDSCLQRFEYSIELAWKTSMKNLGSTTAAAKPAIREMARNNLIENPEVWLSFIEARNQTSHSYDEDTAQKVFAQILLFHPEVEKLIQKLHRAP